MATRIRKNLAIGATVCLTLGLVVGIASKSSQAVFISLVIAASTYGAALLMDWYQSAKSDWKAGRIFEVLIGTAIYSGVVYFIYTFLKLLITGK
jgi:hypothetical protein